VDRIVPDRQYIGNLEQAQQMIQQLQMQLQQIMGQAMPQPPGQGTPAQLEPKNMLPDASQVGGRESNYVSSRPNGG
jgi:outer membrane protein TolC